MESQIKESDWKLFRKIQVTALDRFCQRVLAEVSRLASDTSRSNHERYLAIFKLIQEQDEELAGMFDAPRRSTAMLQLAYIRSHDLLTEEEFARFSFETPDRIAAITEHVG